MRSRRKLKTILTPDLFDTASRHAVVLLSILRHRQMEITALQTLGKLAARGHGLDGYCQICRRHFDVAIAVVIKQRGGDSPVVGMRPLACPRCGSRRTDFRITAPSKG
jgi:hypothetical protein